MTENSIPERRSFLFYFQLLYGAAQVSTFSQDPQAEVIKVSAQIKAKAFLDCIKVKFFFKTEGTESIEIIYGRGGMGQDVVPEFHTQYLTISPSVVKQPGRRSMMNDILTIPPGKKVVYGSYILANPMFPGFGMGNATNEYLEGRFVYREGAGISRPKINVTSNRIGWRELASQ